MTKIFADKAWKSGGARSEFAVTERLNGDKFALSLVSKAYYDSVRHFLTPEKRKKGTFFGCEKMSDRIVVCLGNKA